MEIVIRTDKGNTGVLNDIIDDIYDKLKYFDDDKLWARDDSSIIIDEKNGSIDKIVIGTRTLEGDITIDGSITVVNGTVTTINTDELQIKDNIIELNHNTSGISDYAGLKVYQGEGIDDSILRYNLPSGIWEAGPDIDNMSRILRQIDIYDDLDSTATDKTLSANQGRYLFDMNIDQNEPTGFITRDDSYILFAGTDVTLYADPEFSVYVKAQKLTFNSNLTASLSDTAIGVYFIYIDETGTMLSSVVNPSETEIYNIIYMNAFVCVCYYDGSNIIYIGDERHGITMDGRTHGYLHSTVGSRIGTGFALDALPLSSGPPIDDRNAVVVISSGTMWDEDLHHVIVNDGSAGPTEPFTQDLGTTVLNGATNAAKLPIMYKTGSATSFKWNITTPDGFPYKHDGSLVQYNNYDNVGDNWELSTLSNTEASLVWIVATNNIFNPIVVIVGENEYDSTGDADSSSFPSDITWGDLPFQEFIVLYKLLLYRNNSFPSSHNVKIDTIVDMRYTKAEGLSFSSNDHNNLTGRNAINSHPADAIRVDTTSYGDGILTTEEDVQSVIDTLNIKTKTEAIKYGIIF